MRFHSNNGCTNEPQCYVIQAMPAFLLHSKLTHLGMTALSRDRQARLKAVSMRKYAF